MSTACVMIGNSDDKLPQADWADFTMSVIAQVQGFETRIYGVWFSLSNSEYQNMCISFEVPTNADMLKTRLKDLAAKFEQDSIAWLEGETEMLSPDG